MKRLLICAVLLFTASLFAPFAQAEETHSYTPEDIMNVRIDNVDRGDVLKLIQLGVDIEDVRKDWAKAVMLPDRFAELDRLGYDLTVLPKTKINRAGYHTHATLTSELQDIEAANPTLCKLYNIGNSIQGRALWFMKISDNVNVDEDEPEFKYISTMHGDEVVGMEMCMFLINLLVDDYGTDPQITNLVDNVEIWIMPDMNPDGTAMGMRYNANYADLNRDFPDYVDDPINTTAGREVETAHVMNWNFEHYPVLSANFHGGAMVVNYPFDNDPDPWCNYSATPDDDLFIDQSLTYSTLNIPMYNGSWPQGITNGIAWYRVSGGMQDWNYVWMGCNEVTIELDNDKWPSYSRIPGLWDDNRDAMLAYMERCLEGIRGVVTNSITGDPVAAVVSIQGRDHDMSTDPDVGDYHRMVLPGTYTLKVTAPNFLPKTINGIYVSAGPATRVDVSMTPAYDLIAQKEELSSAGDSLDFTLMAGSSHGSRNYLLLGSASGTNPGFPLPGGFVTLPLNWDVVTDTLLSLTNSPVLPGFMGTLSLDGNAEAHLISPHLPGSSIGTVIHFAYTMNNPFDYVSNAFAVEIVP